MGALAPPLAKAAIAIPQSPWKCHAVMDAHLHPISLSIGMPEAPESEKGGGHVYRVGLMRKIQNGRRRGPQLLGDILPMVLARLGVGAVQSQKSGEADLP